MLVVVHFFYPSPPKINCRCISHLWINYPMKISQWVLEHAI